MASGFTLAVFDVGSFLAALIWAVFAVLNFWIWSKSKATGNLLMLIGGAWFALNTILWTFGEGGLLGYRNIGWTWLLGVGVMTFGFYMSVKPMVEAQLNALKAKMQNLAKHKDAGTGGGAPPPAAK